MRAQPYLVLLFVAISIYCLVFSYFTVLKHNVFQSYAWDLGIFNQAMYTTLHEGQLFYNTVELYFNSSGSYFAVHFSPILFLLLPLYAVNPSPVTLLIIQSCVLPLAALPLYLLAKELLKNNKTAFMLAIAYLLYPAIQGANWFDFHTPALLPLLFFSLCYFRAKHCWKLYFPCVFLVLMIQEQALFVVLVFAAYYFLKSGDLKSFFRLNKPTAMNERLASVLTVLICIVYYAFMLCVKSYFPINPDYLERYKALQAYSVAGVKGDPLFFPFYLIANPQNAFNALMYDYPLKFLYIIFLFAPLLFVPLKSKLAIGVFALLGLFLFSNYKAYYSIGNQYALYIAPLVFIAMIYGLKKFEFKVSSSILKTTLLVTLLFAVSVSPISPASETFARDGFLWYPVISLVPNEETASLNALLGVIPPNASVLAQNTIFPHLSSRMNAYVLPAPDVVNDTEYLRFLISSSEFILLDLTLMDYNTHFVMNEITRDCSYSAYALASKAVLFKRGFQGEPMFSYYTESRVFSAYKDLETAPFSLTISDSSAISGKAVKCPVNQTGYFVFGPYNYLLQGSYEVTFTIKAGEHEGGRLGWCDISSNLSPTVLSKRDFFGFELPSNTWTNITLAFSTTKLLTSVEFRASSYGTTDMYIDRVVMRRVSSNATSNFGSRTYDSSVLSLISGYISDDGFFIFPQHTESSGFWSGPYISLPAGKYRVTFLLKVSPLPLQLKEHLLSLSVTANSGRDVYARREVKTSDFLDNAAPLGWHSFSVEFFSRESLYGVEFAGLFPSSNYSLSLAYILVEAVAVSPSLNYELFSVHRGLQVGAGQIVSEASSESGNVALSRKGLDAGMLVYGPYIALSSGSYEAVFRIKASGTLANASVLFEVVFQPGTHVLSNMTLGSSGLQDGSWFEVALPFSLAAFTSNIEFRVSSNGMTNLYVDTVKVLFR
ncbi:MAG: DUF2079 domain-containing protein [Candidatus Bathyarchaeota archaeon]|nr:DUF2079 domain-containing protein [Candidatus Bathyarchaeota archaeon]